MPTMLPNNHCANVRVTCQPICRTVPAPEGDIDKGRECDHGNAKRHRNNYSCHRQNDQGSQSLAQDPQSLLGRLQDRRFFTGQIRLGQTSPKDQHKQTEDQGNRSAATDSQRRPCAPTEPLPRRIA